MTYKESFIKFAADSGVLIFGDFTLKSGRKAPYFFNAGNFNTGEQLAKLGEYYAQCILENHLHPQTLFGPAYKGIPLATAAATALHNKYSLDVNLSFNRKEAKDHGEGGVIVGKKLSDGEKVVIVEDVVTAGTALREVLPVLKAEADVDIVGMIILIDRMEKGKSDISAVEEIKKDHGIWVFPIVTVLDVIKAIEDGIIEGKQYLEKMKEYRKQYGATN